MAEKVSLEKNSDDIREINKKLDFLINEVVALKSEVNDLKSDNEDKIYKLDSKIYGVCSEVISNLYKLQSTIYNYSSDSRDNTRKITEEVKELQNQTVYSKFVEKLLILSPAFMIIAMTWFILLIILH